MDADDPLNYSDPARAELDRTLEALVAQASHVLKTQSRLRALIKANRAITEGLELSSVLRSIVDAAVELVDAEYGAMGVIAPHGGLEQFIHVGMSTDAASVIGHLPEGHGLLGAVIDDHRTIRLDHLADDPRSVGFPAHHPAMTSFLGVPVRVRDDVFGNLYLTNKRDGSFSVEDEHLVKSLASTAGIAIENARLFEESRRRQAWTAASMEFTRAVLTGSTDSEALLCRTGLTLAEADIAAVVSAELEVSVARDAGDDVIIDELPPHARSTAAAALDTGDARSTRAPEQPDAPTGPPAVLAGPLLAVRVPLDPPKVLVLGRSPGRPPFTPFDARMATAFCAQVAVAVELAAARADQQRMLMLEDRGRIARDLHDHVIQRLFATGLGLQTLASGTSGDTSRALTDAVESLDASIAQIRTVVFALTGNPSSQPGLRIRLVSLADEHSAALGHFPTVTFAGAIDHATTPRQADEFLAVCREALSNAARHSHATATSVHLSLRDDRLQLTVTDNGDGFDPGRTVRRSGIANLRERAQRLGGDCTIGSSSAGTTVDWWIPISADTAELSIGVSNDR
ncbi:GAF domain-containing sensor histidine kinase [Plantibacter flavus]|uniref:GAF domain-containing sensor histidine kinase n=1 Tax=Plantibacter flavus TaxID=150123 RepID=UPI003F189E34